MMAFKRPGWIWLEHAGENATGSAAIAAATVLGYHDLGHVPGATVASVAALAALGSFLKSYGSLLLGPGRSNGTASLNPRVIASRLRARGTNP
jgi:hypothetical protein